jgi:hypothetical protein
MSEINEQVPSTILPIEEEYNYCMFCPMMCANNYMLQDQMMREYNSEDFEDEGEYSLGTGVDPAPPAPVHHGPGATPAPAHHAPGVPPAPVHHGPGVPHAPVHHGPRIWHGHGGYYGNKYYKDINYFYYLRSRYHLYYPYDPYFDYYKNTY